MIEIPLNDKIIEQKETERMDVFDDNVFAPLVTSKMPYKIPETSLFEMLNLFAKGRNNFVAKSKIFNESQISPKR